MILDTKCTGCCTNNSLHVPPAARLGFSAQQRALVLPALVAALERAGASVFEPFVDNSEGVRQG